MPAGQREHILPLRVKKHNNKPNVPTCTECNMAANGQEFDTPADKAKYIRASLVRKYAKVINQPDWTEKELDELGEGLRGYVIAMIELKKLILERVTHVDEITKGHF